MKEDLSLAQQDYSLLLSLFGAGMLTGQIPHALILQKVQPRIWIPLTVIIWSGLTMASAGCKTFSHIATVRFFQGWFEASLYSGTMFIIGSWYRPEEISKRTSIFTSIGQAGSMFAGLMMTAMRKTMHERAGLAGWQWVFIIDGLMGPSAYSDCSFCQIPPAARVSHISRKKRSSLPSTVCHLFTPTTTTSIL